MQGEKVKGNSGNFLKSGEFCCVKFICGQSEHTNSENFLRIACPQTPLNSLGHSMGKSRESQGIHPFWTGEWIPGFGLSIWDLWIQAFSASRSP